MLCRYHRFHTYYKKNCFQSNCYDLLFVIHYSFDQRWHKITKLTKTPYLAIISMKKKRNFISYLYKFLNFELSFAHVFTQIRKFDSPLLLHWSDVLFYVKMLACLTKQLMILVTFFTVKPEGLW